MSSYPASPTLGSAFAAMRQTGFTFTKPAAALRSLPAVRHILADELVLRHLRTADDIAAVGHLRSHIDLALHSAIDPHFHEHEKKETNWA